MHKDNDYYSYYTDAEESRDLHPDSSATLYLDVTPCVDKPKESDLPKEEPSKVFPHPIPPEPPPVPHPCPSSAPLPEIVPGDQLNRAIATHNADENSHKYILDLLRDSMGLFLCRNSIEERDAILPSSRVIGMLVYVVETDMIYQLVLQDGEQVWRDTPLNSQNYIKLGRFNPPSNSEEGMAYFDLSLNEFRFFYKGSWHSFASIDTVISVLSEHDTDVNAHSAKFQEVANVWLPI